MTKLRQTRALKSLALIGCALFACSAVAANAAESADDQWEIKANLYLWGASIEGETIRGSDIDVPFSDLLSNLNFALMGGLDVRKGKWSLLGDVVYMDVEGDNSGTINPVESLPNVVPVEADVRVKGLVVNLAGARNVYDSDRLSVGLVAGGRYLDLEAELTATVGMLTPNTLKTDDFFLDGIVGLKGNINLTDKWFVPYYFDIGAGESDFTTQGFAGIG